MPSGRRSAVFRKAEALAEQANDNPIELAEALWSLKQGDPEDVKNIIQGTGLKPRKAYYLISIWDRFASLDIPKWLLADVGWTKLAIVAKHCPHGLEPSALDLAQRNTAKELERILITGQHTDERKHAILLYLSPDQYKLFKRAVLAHGATSTKNGRGLIGKEKALTKVVRKALASG